MSWFDQLQRGSFRGVEFLFSDSDGDIGRRSVVFEYPGRDLPFVEDLGRRARTWSLDLIVAGPDYMAWRDRLIEAIEQPGPGILIHPTLGQLKVSVLNARGPRESTREGGLARFAVTFIESGENRYPAAAEDGQRAVYEKAAVAQSVLSQQIEDDLDISGQGFIGEDAIDQVQYMADTIRKTIAGLPELAGSTDLMQAITTLGSSAASLILTPVDLCGALSQILGDIVTAAERPALALAALKSFWSYGGTGGVIPQTTASRIQQDSNRTALNDLFVTSATIASGQAASSAQYDSQDDADSASAAIASQIDTVMLTAVDAVYSALTDLRAALIADLGNRFGLPRITRYTPIADIPALVLAHRFYGDASREADIVARNHIAHPGFVPGGKQLEVLGA